MFTAKLVMLETPWSATPQERRWVARRIFPHGTTVRRFPAGATGPPGAASNNTVHHCLVEDATEKLMHQPGALETGQAGGFSPASHTIGQGSPVIPAVRVFSSRQPRPGPVIPPARPGPGTGSGSARTETRLRAGTPPPPGAGPDTRRR